MWPFKQKEDAYTSLRASVGMGPASPYDLKEFVTWVVIFEIKQARATNHKKTLPADEQKGFMNAYAAYYTWLAKKTIKDSYPPDKKGGYSPLIKRELLKDDWYDERDFDRIIASLDQRGVLNTQGRNFGVSLGPRPSVILAANHAGIKLTQTIDAQFLMEVGLCSSQFVKTISRRGGL